MASNEYSVGPRISIEGAAEFKAHIREINSEYRSLRAEMANVQTSFKGQETSEKSLIAQQSNLTKQIETQKQKIKETTEQLEKYKESTGATTENVNKYNEMISKSKADLANLENQLKEVNKTIDIQNSKWGRIQTQMETVSRKATDAGKKFSTVGSALTKTLTVPIAAVGTGMIASAKEFEGGMATVIKATGASGKAAKDLENAYKKAASNVAGNMGDIGAALGEINTRLGFSGSQAEKATEDFMKFSKVTGTDAKESVRLVTRAMGDANMKSDDYRKMLNMLTVASQKTGISVEDLTNNITKYGAPMRQLGFTTQQSVAMFAQWEKAGVTTEKAFAGMRIAISGWMKQGKNASEEFKKTVKGIQDGTISTAEAMEIFGKKGGPDMVDAIKQGRFNFDEFSKSLSNTNGALDKTYKNTLTSTDKLQIEMNKLKVASAESGAKIIKSLLPSLTKIMDAAAGAAKKFAELPEPAQNAVLALAGIAAVAGPAASGVGSVMQGVGKLSGTLSKFAGAKAAKAVAEVGTASAGAAEGMGAAATAAEGLGGATAAGTAGAAGLGASLGSILTVAGPVGIGIGAVVVAIRSYRQQQATANQMTDYAVSKADKLATSANTLTARVKGLSGSFTSSVATVQAHAALADNLNGKLQNLVATQGRTASGQAQIKQMVDKLNQIVPGLNLAYDAQTNKLSQTNKEIKNHINNMVKEAKQTAAQEVLVKAYKAQYEAQYKQAQIETQLSANKKKLNALDEKRKDLMKDGGWARHGKELTKIKGASDKLNESNKSLNSSLSKVKKNYTDSGNAAKAAEKVLNGSAKNMGAAFAQMKNKSKGTGKAVEKNVKIDSKAVAKNTSAVVNQSRTAFNKIPAAAKTSAKGAMAAFNSQNGAMGAAGRAAGNRYAAGVRSKRGNAHSAGVNVTTGLNNGIKSKIPATKKTTGDLVSAIKKTFVKGLGIHSPSHVTYEYGRYTGLGFINGLSSTQIGKYTRATVNDMKKAFSKNKFSAEANVNYLDDNAKKEVTWMRKYDGGSIVKGADGGKGNRFINTMLGLVNNNSHGYSQSDRWGPDFDCSSSIIYSLKKTGFAVGGASYTGNMSSELTKHGWARIPNNGKPKKGDILLNDAKHVELSLGGGKTAGFHGTYGHPEKGDQTGKEASVGKYYNFPWNAYLRYKKGFGDSLADAIEEVYNFKKYGIASGDIYGADGDGGGFGGGKVSGKLGDWVKQALKLTGQPMSLAAGLVRAAKAESGGNPRAVNNWDINARLGHPSKGLMQTIDSTFNAYKMKGHGNIWNPVDNLIASIRYMIARYGSVANVLRPRARRWYGYDVGSRYIPYTMPAIVHEGEMIIPKSENPYRNSKGSITGAMFGDQAVMNIGSAIDRLSGSVRQAVAASGGVTVNVYGAAGQSVDELTDQVVDKIVNVYYGKAAMISA